MKYTFLNVPQKLDIGEVVQSVPRIVRPRRTTSIVKEGLTEEYSKSKPNPKYFSIPESYQKGTPAPTSNRNEWFQYGIGTNTVPDKTTSQIEADRLAMNKE